jgi:peptide/nickel transport system substrate-binding protein
MKTLLRAAAILLVGAALFIGCGGGEEQVVDTETGGEPQFEGLTDIEHTEWEVGRKGGRVILPLLSDPKTFNNIVADETSTTDITERLFTYIVRRNQFTLEWEPALAERWEISEDEKTVTYTLRDDLKWSDGEPLTSADFVDAVNEVYYNEAVAGAGSIRNSLNGAGGPSIWEVIDERTFSVTLPNVYAGIFGLTQVAPLPMHVFGPLLENEGPEAIDSFWGVNADVTEIVSCGPFVVDEYVPGQRVVLGPNPHYYETDAEGTQLPYADEVVFQIIADQDTMLQNFIAGDLSYLALRGEDYGVLVDRQEELGFTLYNVGADTATDFIAFNQNPIEGEEDAGLEEPMLTWLSNKTFREAMAHLVDRETIINNIAFGFGYPQYSFVPRISPYYWDGADEAAPKYDPQKAADLLDSIDYVDRDEDGFREDPNGNRISLTLSTNAGNREREAIITLFAQEASAVGIEVTPNPIDFNALVGQLTSTYDWELMVIGLTGSLDPITGVNVYPSDGALHMIEPSQESPRRDWEKTVDEAWKTANFTTDEQQRKEGWQIIQEVWIEEMPWVFTYNAAVMHGYVNSLGNIYPHPIEDYDWEGILHRLYFQE